MPSICLQADSCYMKGVTFTQYVNGVDGLQQVRSQGVMKWGVPVTADMWTNGKFSFTLTCQDGSTFDSLSGGNLDASVVCNTTATGTNLYSIVCNPASGCTNPGYTGGGVPPSSCSPSTVTNGTVNGDCSITCNSGYTLSSDGQSCVSDCGTTASGSTAASYAPTTNLCVDGTTPTVTPSGGNWTWSCGSSSCSAPISTPSIAAGCAVDELISPNGSGGERPNQETSNSCSSFGYSSSNQVVASVGTVLETNMTVSGPQYFYDFGEFSHGVFFGSAGYNRFTVSWSGGLNSHAETGTNGDQFAASPVPNGSYSEFATVTDTYTGNQMTFGVSVNKQTSPPICKTCSVQ
ncbi:MAG: hypothetical protein JO253_04570 [Alphaproteobacteria bacterium]|nr:hypothetical protein [Alphaproteobacteria bacterium]